MNSHHGWSKYLIKNIDAIFFLLKVVINIYQGGFCITLHIFCLFKQNNNEKSDCLLYNSYVKNLDFSLFYLW